MQKLGIPITVENASQFENYMNDSQAITRELDALIEQFPQESDRNRKHTSKDRDHASAWK